MAIISAKETTELFKQRPKEYEGGYIYVPIAGKTPPPPSAKATPQRKKKPEGDRQMKYSIATKEETAAFWKERKERLGDHAVVSIPIMSGRRRRNQVETEKDKLKKHPRKSLILKDV